VDNPGHGVARQRPEGATGGVGLGLAICRGIVEAHGGRIRAANAVGGGAEFTFTLPIGEGAPHIDLEPAEAADPKEIEELHGG